jgi:AraC-like DNA-binding protein
VRRDKACLVSTGRFVTYRHVNTTISIDPLAVFVFLGVFLGFVLSYFFIRSSAVIQVNKYQGLLLLSLSLCILEQWLNLTGYIVKLLPITNFTEPINLAIGPFLYLFVKKSIDQSRSKGEWIHFILFFLYLGYSFFDFIQSNDFKYNSYVNSYHPDWPLLDAQAVISNDPLDIKKYLNTLTSLQLIFYIGYSLYLLARKAAESKETIFNTGDGMIRSLRNLVFHIFAILIIFVLVKLNYKADLGDYFIGMYVSVFTLVTTYKVMSESTYFNRLTSFTDISPGKYRKSSLDESGKMNILNKIILEFEKGKYYSDNLASLSELSKKISESPHHVSQVMNEKLNRSFFELLAVYRVEEAKRILSGDKGNRLTVEEISEMVGYNSKTAFNNAFKKCTGKTPSDFRRSAQTLQ